MNESIRQIAQRLKAARDIDGRSVDVMARHLSVDPALYASYESGARDIPVSILLEAARLLGMDLTALLTGGEPRLRHYCLVRSGRGIIVERRKEYRYQDLAYNFAGKKAEAFLVTVDPGTGPAARNSHAGQEFVFMLEGDMTVEIADNTLSLRAGDSLYFDSAAPHAMRADGSSPATFLALIL